MQIIEKKNLLPFILVTSLFLLWGLANSMTDTLLAAFRNIMDMSDTEASLIQFAFYGSYFCFALPVASFIQRKSYKAGILLGLLLYATGAILFLPAAMTESYFFYLIAIYIMAGGCSALETTANPYILSMGAPETATRRLNIAQSFNPLGNITGILMSKYFILAEISLYSISGTYTALGLVLLGILFAMLLARMPEGKDGNQTVSIFNTIKRLARNEHYALGVVAQFFYVGAQTGVWSFTIRVVMQELDIVESEASTFYLISIIGFCLSRFVYTYLMKWFSPNNLLAFGGIMSALCAFAVTMSEGTGYLLVAMLISISLFMSLMFPTIYGITLGKVVESSHPEDAKIGASGLIMSIVGGAILTPMQGMVSDNFGAYASYIVPCIAFIVITGYAFKTKMK